MVLSGAEAEVIHVTDPREIVSHGILSTPGLIIDGRILATGASRPLMISRSG